jgi:hypothetical protein
MLCLAAAKYLQVFSDGSSNGAPAAADAGARAHECCLQNHLISWMIDIV